MEAGAGGSRGGGWVGGMCVACLFVRDIHWRDGCFSFCAIFCVVFRFPSHVSRDTHDRILSLDMRRDGSNISIFEQVFRVHLSAAALLHRRLISVKVFARRAFAFGKRRLSSYPHRSLALPVAVAIAHLICVCDKEEAHHFFCDFPRKYLNYVPVCAIFRRQRTGNHAARLTEPTHPAAPTRATTPREH